VWAHAYDERLEDLFTVQDEVTRQLVGALGVSIRDAEKQRTLRKPTKDLGAYDLVLRAGQLWAEASPAEHLQLRNLMERAVALDPGYARAQGMLAFAYLDEYRWQYNPHPDRPDPLKSALEHAELAVRLDPADAYTHYALAKIAYYTKELDLAEREFNKTFALNPSAADPRADWGIRLAVMGRPDEGVALTREAIRLNPAYPGWYHFALAADALHKGDFDRAVAESENIGLRQLLWTQVWLCASYAHAGRTDEARAAAREILKLYPPIEKDWNRQTTVMHSWDPRFKDIVTQGLRKAGLFANAK
jgi:Tfp pilus assembly protein PilF